MSIHELSTANILDLTSKQTLFELAIEPRELLGAPGAKLIAEIKERAAHAEYTHLYFRDPMRPGIVWFSPLGDESGPDLPTRGRLDQCRRIAESVFPDFLERLEARVADVRHEAGDERACDSVIQSEIPPLTEGNASAMELVTALEYILFVYPEMVRAWAALIFTYDQILGLKEGAQSAQEECMHRCMHAQLVAHLVGDALVEA